VKPISEPNVSRYRNAMSELLDACARSRRAGSPATTAAARSARPPRSICVPVAIVPDVAFGASFV
jgi:hypothetical protein